MDTPNPMFAKFDQILGKTTPTSSATPVSSRANEIRDIAKTATPSAPQKLTSAGVSEDSGLFNSQSDTGKANAEDIQKNVSSLGSDLSKRAGNIHDALLKRPDTNTGIATPGDALQTGAEVAKDVTGMGADIITHGFRGLTDLVSNIPEVKDIAGKEGIGKALDAIKTGTDVALAPAKVALAKWEQDHPQVARLIENLAKTGLNISMFSLPESAEVRGAASGLVDEAGNLIKNTATKGLELADQGAKKVIDTAGQAGERMGIAKEPIVEAPKPKPVIDALQQTEETMTPTQKKAAVDEGRQVITDKKLGDTKVEYKPTPEIERANTLLEGKVKPDDTPNVVTEKIKGEIKTKGGEAEKYLESNAQPITNKEHYDMFDTLRKDVEKTSTETELKAYDEQIKLFSKQLPGRGSYDTSTYYKALKDWESNIADKLPRGKDAILDPTGVASAKIRAAADIRKAVRDTIGDKHPEFKPKMYDLASLYDAKDLAIQNASKVKSQTFFEKHPTAKKVLKGAAIVAGADVAIKRATGIGM